MKKSRVTLSTMLDKEVMESLRDYVYWTPGETISSIIERTLKDFLSQKKPINPRPSTNQHIGKKLIILR
jgi:hypothetical protein